MDITTYNDKELKNLFNPQYDIEVSNDSKTAKVINPFGRSNGVVKRLEHKVKPTKYKGIYYICLNRSRIYFKLNE